MRFSRCGSSSGSAWNAAQNLAFTELLHHIELWRGSMACCWEWPHLRNSKGYGIIIFNGYTFLVHRVSFRHFKESIPEGMVIMHDCDNPPCFNPDHLLLGTHADNMADMVSKGRSHGARMSTKPACVLPGPMTELARQVLANDKARCEAVGRASFLKRLQTDETKTAGKKGR